MASTVTYCGVSKQFCTTELQKNSGNCEKQCGKGKLGSLPIGGKLRPIHEVATQASMAKLANNAGAIGLKRVICDNNGVCDTFKTARCIHCASISFDNTHTLHTTRMGTFYDKCVTKAITTAGEVKKEYNCDEQELEAFQDWVKLL